MDDYENFNIGYEGEERITDGELLPTDENENILRPTTLDEYVGQDKIKENLRVFIHSAKKRAEALDHVLLYGPPGWITFFFTDLRGSAKRPSAK